jgi:glyoxylase-like metal-dependent hydrolase (beta-lactamase superfamily II)
MYELKQGGPDSYYIDCPAKIGVYAADPERVVLGDSGNDKDAGRKVLKVLAGQGWKLSAIVNTHSNADHIGGNRYLATQTGCRIFAGGIEGDFTRPHSGTVLPVRRIPAPGAAAQVPHGAGERRAGVFAPGLPACA